MSSMIREIFKFIVGVFAFVGALHLVQCEWHAGELDFHLETKEQHDGETQQVE